MTAPTSPSDQSAGGEEPGIFELVTQLIADAKHVARAELGLCKAKAKDKVFSYKDAAIFFGLASGVAMAATTGLVVGLILTLSPHVGPGWATAIVVIGALVVAGVLALIGRSKLAARRIARRNRDR